MIEENNVNNTSVDTSVDTSVVENTSVDTSVVDTSVVEQPSNLDNNTAIAQESSTQVSSDRQRHNEELNFKALREAKKQIERERDELKAQLSRATAASANSDDDLYDDTSVDDISETKKELKELKNQWSAYQNQTKVVQIEQKLKKDFPDLESVVNDDSIDLLKARDKSFAKIIDTAPRSVDELYNRAVSAYTLIKKYGIYVEDKHIADKQRVEKNLAKPRPVSSASNSVSEGLADFAEFAHLSSKDKEKAIYNLARKRAGLI